MSENANQSKIDSKFRLITIAAKRCEQLHRGARPRFGTGSKKWAYVALEEVKRGLVDFEILESPPESEDDAYDGDIFLEGDIGEPIVDDPVPLVNSDEDDDTDDASMAKKSKTIEQDMDDGSQETEDSADEDVSDDDGEDSMDEEDADDLEID